MEFLLAKHFGLKVLGAWNFTLQADTPLYWLRCGRLDKWAKSVVSSVRAFGTPMDVA